MGESAPPALHELVEDAARRWPEQDAVCDPARGVRLSYAELRAHSDRVASALRAHGVGPGERVGLCLPKSADAVIALLGILKAGAAYVPVDAGAPPSRNAYILADCGVRVALVDEPRAPALREALAEHDAEPSLWVLAAEAAPAALLAALPRVEDHAPAPGRPDPDALAYILYTSGSTGRPKGVMLSHGNAVSFVRWASALVEPTPNDRFSSHAPFHFDLSILDLYVCLSAGATLVLVAEAVARAPQALGPWIAEQGITVWYSAPTILTMLAHYGRLPRYEFGRLRVVLFAGEVFPVKHLRAIKQHWPAPRYFNLYGPTETNVCTYHEIPERIPAEREQPYPIGRACEHLEVRVVDQRGEAAAGGAEGELQVRGPGVMQGYWQRPERTAAAFVDGWYRTGDVVSRDEEGALVFVGRRDRMVKRRGYRIELGEIEAALYRHERLEEVAVIARAAEDGGVLVKAYLCVTGGAAPSIIALKQHCAAHLPVYMVPDRFEVLERLPKTSTDKVDYQALRART